MLTLIRGDSPPPASVRRPSIPTLDAVTIRTGEPMSDWLAAQFRCEGALTTGRPAASHGIRLTLGGRE